MKIFINFVRLPKTEVNDYVFNSNSNNVWPTTGWYTKRLEWWGKLFEQQNRRVKRYIHYLTHEKKIGNETFLIQVKNIISNRLKLIRDPDYKYIDEGKIIELTDLMRQEEIMSLKEGLKIFDNDKYFKKDWANTELKEEPNWLTTRWRFEEWNKHRRYPIAKVNDLLKEWWKDYNKLGEEFPEIEQIESQQIQLKERTSDTITFVWKVPITTEKNEHGKEFKNRVFPHIPLYFFFLNGVYYEVLDWEQTNWDTAEVVAEENIFYTKYWWLLKGGISGIIRNCPTGVSQEVCACFNTDFLNVRNKFICNLKLVFDTWKVSKSEYKEKNTITDFKDSPEPAFTIVAAGIPVKLGAGREEVDEAIREISADYYNPETQEWTSTRRTENARRTENDDRRGSATSTSGTGNRIATQREIERSNSAWNKFCRIFTGDAGIIYLLFNRKLKQGSWYANTYWNVKTKIGGKEVYNSDNGTVNSETKDFKMKWMRAGKWDDSRKQTSLEEPDYLKFLKKEGLMNEDGTITEMYHFLMEHVQITFMWRNKPVWAGIYKEISADLRVDESVSAAGNCYTVSANGQILFSVTELVSAKVGGNDKTSAFWSTLITVGTTVAAAAATGGMAAGVAATATKAGMAAAGSIASRGVSNLIGSGLNVTETNITMTVHEFKHKFMLSGTNPLSMNIEWCGEALNRYRNMRELLGVNTSTFINNPELGQYLTKPGFIRFVEIYSLGIVGGKYDAWFRRKLTEGVFLNTEPYENYEKKLSGTQFTASIGGIIRKNWNELISSEVFTIAITLDHLSHLGGGMYIYKTSQLTIGNQGNKMTWLMDHIINKFGIENKSVNIPGQWTILHPSQDITNYNLEIPMSWRNKEKAGNKLAEVHYQMFSFSDPTGTSKDSKADEHWCDYLIINKFSYGNTTKITIGLHGHNIYENKTPGSENIPPAGTIPLDPLAGNAKVSLPPGIQGTVPPGSDAEILTTPDTGSPFEMEPPEPEPVKEKEKPMEKEQVREKDKTKEKTPTKQKTKTGQKSGEK